MRKHWKKKNLIPGNWNKSAKRVVLWFMGPGWGCCWCWGCCMWFTFKGCWFTPRLRLKLNPTPSSFSAISLKRRKTNHQCVSLCGHLKKKKKVWFGEGKTKEKWWCLVTVCVTGFGFFAMKGNWWMKLNIYREREK